MKVELSHLKMQSQFNADKSGTSNDDSLHKQINDLIIEKSKLNLQITNLEMQIKKYKSEELNLVQKISNFMISDKQLRDDLVKANKMVNDVTSKLSQQETQLKVFANRDAT